MRPWMFAALAMALVGPAWGQQPIRDPLLPQAPGTWVKRSPLENTPPSPRLGYEGACVYDTRHGVLIRYGGHNQGGGGEQGSEVWVFDPLSARWQLMLPNVSPPGVCCAQQNVFDPVLGRMIRFPAFSGSHGWQWFREIYLNNTSVWTYDLEQNRWQNMRPWPAPRVSSLRCASWDEEFQVAVLFGGQGNNEGTVVYDPWTNTWTRMNPPEQPPFRSAGNMAYDSRHRVHVLFGLQFREDPYTWIYSLRENRWQRRRPEPSPPARQNDAVLCYDSVAGKVVAVVKITTGKGEQAKHRLETWLYDVGQDRWQRANPPQEPDPTSNRARVLVYAPDLNVALLENRVHGRERKEQQIWSWRTVQRPRPLPLPPPQQLQVKTTPEEVHLRWSVPKDQRIREVVLEWARAEVPWKARFRELARLKPQTTRYTHRPPDGQGVLMYRLRSVDAQGNASRPSQFVRAQPRVVEQLVVSVLAPREVHLKWQAPPGKDIAGYIVERAPVAVYSNSQLVRIREQTPAWQRPVAGGIKAVGQFERLTPKPIPAAEFTDTAVDLNQTFREIKDPVFQGRWFKSHLVPEGKPYPWGVYAYRVRAVNALGVESGPSPAVLTIPSPVQYVFSREEGTTCHLKWEPNPEKGLRGYLVFRMDGRFAGSLVHPLNEKPVRETVFQDPEAGKRTRRYYVVAVDALGQQGHPSSPVWHRRQWQRFYVPFVGPWHQ